MATTEEDHSLVPKQRAALQKASPSLVTRGLTDLLATRQSWELRNLLFRGKRKRLAISHHGRVATHALNSSVPNHRVEVFDIERPSEPTVLNDLGLPSAKVVEEAIAFAWSPTSDLLATAKPSGSEPLRPSVFLFNRECCIHTFGAFADNIQCLAWSASGKYLAASVAGWEGHSITLWETEAPANDRRRVVMRQVAEVAPVSESEPLFYSGETEVNEAGLWGFGRLAFSPDETMLAVIEKTYGDWNDDAVVLLTVPDLKRIEWIETYFKATDLSWQADGTRLIFCCDGRVMSLDLPSLTEAELSFDAQFCRCHPKRHACAFFSPYKPGSKQGRLYVADLTDNRIMGSECEASWVLDLVWSADGNRLYAVTDTGEAVVGHFDGLFR